MKYYIPYAFKFNTQNIKTDVLPGTPELCNGIWIYTVNKKETKNIVEELFTDKVEELDENNTNTITNEITSNTSVTNNINSSTTKVSNEIKIELLNGSEDNSILTKVKEKLERKGYTISKTEKTSGTSVTTIINRTKQSESKVNDLKEIIGVGTTTSGLNNSKVDFTIIIGKDYK